MITSQQSSSQNRGLDAGLLLLRLGVGLSLLLIFGLQKLQAGWAYAHTGQWPFVDFNRKIGLPLPVFFAYVQTLNESFAALFLALGLWSRYSAAALSIGFAAATLCSMKAAEPWLTAAYFCMIFTSLLLTGPGGFSIDALLKSRNAFRSRISPQSVSNGLTK